MPYQPFDLTGKVALVTGGNGGIGLGMAKALAAAGAAVCIWGTNEEKNAAALAALETIGVEALALRCDVADKSAVDQPCPPTQIFFGENEEFFNVADARAWIDGQVQQGKDSALTIFPGAGHAFFNDTRADAYHEASARQAWATTVEHFRKHLN